MNYGQETKMNEKKPEDAYFVVYYDKKGDILKVEPPEGKIVQEFNEDDIFKNGMNGINKLDTNLVLSKKGNTPCCIKCGRTYYCWC